MFPSFAEIRENTPFSNVVSRPVTPEYGLFLAEVSKTPYGKLGISYVMVSGERNRKEGSTSLFDQAFKSFERGLDIDAMDTGEGMVFQVRRKESFAASAIGLPGFASKARDWAKSTRVVAVAPNPDTLYVVAEGSKPAVVLLEGVKGETFNVALDFEPCAFLIDDNAISTLWMRPD